jgi:hypothetical protein
VLRAPRTGGPLEVIASQPLEISSNSEPGIGLDGSHVFWVGERGIYRAPRAGGTPELWIRDYCVSDLLIQDGTAFFSCVYDANIRAVATDAAPISDVSTVVPLSLAFHAGPLRLHEGTLYFRSEAAEIGRQRRGSTSVEKLDLRGSGAVRGFDVVDGAVIAAVANGAETSSLLRLAAFKGPPTVLVSGDDQHVKRVYASTEAWTYWQGQGVFRVPR